MKLTTRDILLLLPLEEDFRKELLHTFDTAPEEQQFRISVVAWEQYYNYEDLKLQENIQKGLAEASIDPAKQNPDFFKKVEDVTHKEIESETTSVKSDAQLGEVRKAMETIVKEIQAAKLLKK